MSGLFFRIATALAVVWSVFVPGASAATDERVTEFRSRIEIRPDSTLSVEEEISINVTGASISHGIFRDIPTKYKDRLGNNYVVGLKVLSVTRDGYPEPYSVSNYLNGKRIKIGDPNRFVSYGPHAYSIIYEASGELGFFRDYDELYWNVTGNGWRFPIDKVLAVIKLPEGVKNTELKLAAWTGALGSRGDDYLSSPSETEVIFESTRPLEIGEGMTIAVSWPKGFVAKPKIPPTVVRFLSDNPQWFSSLIALAIIIGYYLIIWFLVGRDPERRAVVVEYGPPENLSPAEMRFLTAMKSDDVAFTSSLINMAVKGYLRIDDNSRGYTVAKTGIDEGVLTADEKAVAAKLFKERDKVSLNPENYDIIFSAKSALTKQLTDRFGKNFFVRNSSYATIGALISIGAILILHERFLIEDIVGLAVAAMISATIFLSLSAVAKIKHMRGREKLGALVTVLITLVFAPTLFNIASFAGGSITANLFYTFSAIAVNSLFLHLISRRTPAGQRIQEKIIGFKRYLSLAEKDRMNFHNPPEMTPEIFERFLPYALALGVAHEWAEIFSTAINSFGPEKEYRAPSWYHSSRSISGYSGLASELSAVGGGIAAAVYSSSNASPGSGSAFGGGGGGGFSGGGGGGGGGGGW